MRAIRRRQLPSIRTLGLLGLLTLTALVSPAICSQSISLPGPWDGRDMLESFVAEEDGNGIRVRMGVTVSGMNNVSSLWDLDEGRLPAHRFDEGSAYAVLQGAEWVRVDKGGWWIGYARGKRSAYDGNADAAQLWIDLNADGQTQSEYAPSAGEARITVSSYALGHTFPIEIGSVRGTGDIAIRRLAAQDYRARSLVGQVEGDQFSGMLGTVTSSSETDDVRGLGWAVDAQIRFRMSDRWRAKMAIDSAMGEIAWRGLMVQQGYITSPGVFEDPEGFLHGFGGMSGAEWREDMTLRLNPCFRLDLVYTKRPYLLLGLVAQRGTRTLPSIGAAWPQSRPWLPYVRCFPTQQRLELGAVGSRWRIGVSGDDWIFADPKHAEVSLSINVPLS